MWNANRVFGFAHRGVARERSWSRRETTESEGSFYKSSDPLSDAAATCDPTNHRTDEGDGAFLRGTIVAPGFNTAAVAARSNNIEEGTMMESDEFTKSIEEYTAAIPSSAYLGLGMGAIALSLFLQAGGRGKWGNFVAQWVPTILIVGLYNKLVKVAGHDRNTGSAKAIGR
jgi:hypothetical protein